MAAAGMSDFGSQAPSQEALWRLDSVADAKEKEFPQLAEVVLLVDGGKEIDGEGPLAEGVNPTSSIQESIGEFMVEDERM
jgi:hypothetical protein